MALTASKLLDVLGNVPASDGHRYHLQTTGGRRMDCLSVCPGPDGTYLGVYYSEENDGRRHTHLAWSKNLLDWAHVTKLANDAVMPEIKEVNGFYLLAFEHTPEGKPNHIVVRRYRSLDRLAVNKYDKVFHAPNTLSPWAEGTPSFRPGTNQDTIKLGFHYLSRSGSTRDRQARATLKGWADWKAEKYSAVQSALPATTGGIGERSFIRPKGGCVGGYEVIERQGSDGDFQNWSIWLFSTCTRKAKRVPVKTHGGSPSVGNPNVSRLYLPDGRLGTFVTYFLFTPAAAPGEGGPLAFYRAD